MLLKLKQSQSVSKMPQVCADWCFKNACGCSNEASIDKKALTNKSALITEFVFGVGKKVELYSFEENEELKDNISHFKIK